VESVDAARDSSRAAQNGWGWMDRSGLARLEVDHAAQHGLAENRLRELETGEIPERRAPWARPGWYAEVQRWVDGELARLGQSRSGPLEPVRSWGLSCVIRVPTPAGNTYFKAGVDLPLFANEPAVLRELATRFSPAAPRPICIDAERRWMLLADFGEPLDGEVTPEVYEKVLHSFGRLQMDSAALVGELMAVGVLDRRLDQLARESGLLLDDPEVRAELEADEIAQLREAMPGAVARCGELARARVPHTISHGDLHLGNIALVDGKPVFFDWTDACVAHPFLDAVHLLSEVKDGNVQDQLTESYLSLWSPYEPMGRLQELWRLARPLSSMHQAISYRYIMRGLEPMSRTDLSGAIGLFLRRILVSAS
jgi:hypothetical protein